MRDFIPNDEGMGHAAIDRLMESFGSKQSAQAQPGKN